MTREASGERGARKTDAWKFLPMAPASQYGLPFLAARRSPLASPTMTIPRICVALPLSDHDTVDLPADAVNHLRVLRMRPGKSLVLFNGEGGEYPAQLLALERRGATVRLGVRAQVEAESPMPVVLYQGVSRGDRMDWAIQKAVELGVGRIVPVFTSRSVVQLSADRLEKKRAHWQAVVTSACEQCGRNRLPVVDMPLSYAELLNVQAPGLRLLLEPDGGSGPGDLSAPGDNGVSLLVGPEGGLTGKELTEARSRHWQPLLLGPRVLRTETAGIAALAVIQTLWGDF